MRFIILILVLVLKLALTSAHAEVCTDTNISILKACAEKNYRIVDEALGKKYHQLMEESDGGTKNALISAEKTWIKYKESSCEPNGNAGAEASLDKLGCLIKLTKLRSDELSYLSIGIGMFGFFSHLAFESEDDSVNRGIVIGKLISKFVSSKDNYWRSYVAQNCKMTSTLLSEDQNMCVAHLTFYKN
ncbi:hypothetical protein AWB69_03307 [Caballeronia udeis]|uniref:Lysozyme inhibitor LprI-like N-terminal domain-containing protein n=1 Tax=Caballeronia udeis TaxID=1232866 RepID=A0A158GUE9_9BURK|nr:lysozyme inhibitor LprI family protein [Caballeronia udeis]SAL35421.1 hypothetical protein AWB69_03307 [Caballeronia udeis]